MCDKDDICKKLIMSNKALNTKICRVYKRYKCLLTTIAVSKINIYNNIISYIVLIK